MPRLALNLPSFQAQLQVCATAPRSKLSITKSSLFSSTHGSFTLLVYLDPFYEGIIYAKKYKSITKKENRHQNM
jgi:hypothetical protein